MAQLSLVFCDVKFLLLYFPSTATFIVSAVEELPSWTEQVYSSLCSSLSKKVWIDAQYDGSTLTSIIVQGSKLEESLEISMEYFIRLKKLKKTPIEKILAMIPRLETGKRTRFPALKV
jgi:hypothetical protein